MLGLSFIFFIKLKKAHGKVECTNKSCGRNLMRHYCKRPVRKAMLNTNTAVGKLVVTVYGVILNRALIR